MQRRHDSEKWTGLKYWKRRRIERPLPGLVILAIASFGWLALVILSPQPLDDRLVWLSGAFLALAWLGCLTELASARWRPPKPRD